MLHRSFASLGSLLKNKIQQLWPQYATYDYLLNHRLADQVLSSVQAAKPFSETENKLLAYLSGLDASR